MAQSGTIDRQWDSQYYRLSSIYTNRDAKLTSFAQTIQRLDAQLLKFLGIDKLAAFIKANAYLLIFLSITGVIAYGYDFFSFALKIDSENHAFGYGPHGSWVAQGRWGMYLLSYLLFPDVVMPFIPTLVAVSGLAIGALFFVHSLSDRRSAADYFAAPITFACPIVYFAMYFTTLGYGIGIGFAVCCLGIYLLKKPTWLSALFAVLCFALAIGIYQAMLPLIATLFCLQVIAAILEEKDLAFMALLRRGLIFLGVIAMAGLVHQIISQLFLKGMNIAFDEGYMMGFVNFETTPAYLIETFNKTAKIAWDYYRGDNNYYLQSLSGLKVLFLFTLTVSIFRILTAKSSLVVRLIGVLLLLFAIAAPFAMHMLNSAYMPPRSVLGVSFVFAGLIFFTASLPSKVIRITVGILAIYILFSFSVINNRYAFSSQMVWYADRELSVLMLDRIHAAMSKMPQMADPNAQLPLELVGWLEYPQTPIMVQREVIGASFFKWSAGDVDRVVRLFSTMGVSRYRAATKQEKLSVIEGAKLMPSWPYDGSVDVVNGIIVVKLRDYNPNQLMRMCAPPDENNPACLKYAPQ
jgi:hypothetical protein